VLFGNVTGMALSNAEKQRHYRQRIAARAAADDSELVTLRQRVALAAPSVESLIAALGARGARTLAYEVLASTVDAKFSDEEIAERHRAANLKYVRGKASARKAAIEAGEDVPQLTPEQRERILAYNRGWKRRKRAAERAARAAQ
jgi:hypothetical protein